MEKSRYTPYTTCASMILVYAAPVDINIYWKILIRPHVESLRIARRKPDSGRILSSYCEVLFLCVCGL